jgi:hypothetical protein
MPLLLVDRYHQAWQRTQQVAIDAGRLRKVAELELLEPKQLPALAKLSLQMFLLGAVFFAVLNLVAYYWQQHTLAFQVTIGGVLLWLGANIVSYIVIICVHEIIHSLVFLFWGGRPHFGAKLPLALYCGAKDQLFRRNQYLVVGLAPLVVITLAGITLTILAPSAASYVFLATIGNIAGAAGDVWVTAHLLRQPHDILVEDTDKGCRIWLIEP